MVLNESGDPVEGLNPDDFSITDEGLPRPLSRFEAVVVPESQATEDHEIGFASTNTPPGPSLRTFVVVFDDVHMGRTTARSAKQAVRDFVETLGPGDRVSLAPTSGGAWWHARIPEGRRDLLSALTRLQGLRPRNFSADRISDHEAMRLQLHRDPRVLATVTRRYLANGVILKGPGLSAAGGLPHPIISGRAAEVYQTSRTRRKTTYDVLRRVAEALEATRGRKSILFLSEGFIQEPGLPEHGDLLAVAQQANAVVHFLDARGLVGLPASAGADIGPPTGGLFSDSGDVLDQMGEPHLESLGAVSLAVDTGGRILKNANDLARGFRRLEHESRAYYLLGFEPTDIEADGSFHRLEVEVRRPGVEVLTRKGYYAPIREEESSPSDGSAAGTQLRRALDSPFDIDTIPLKIASYLLGPTEGQTTALFAADIDPRALTFEEEGEEFKGGLGIALVVVSRDTGKDVQRLHEIALSFPAPVFSQVRQAQLPLLIDVPLAQGRHQARLLVRDLRSGVIGTVRHELEVPPPDAFRISTPILADIGSAESGAPLDRPRPQVRRTFVAGQTMALSYEVYGAEAQSGSPAHVVARFHVESASGTVLATQPDAVLLAGPEGEISQTATISLASVSSGHYVVVVSARDAETGRETETRVPFRVAPRPATVVGTETPSVAPVTDPEVAALLEHAGRYVLEYEERFRDIVAEETYTQRVDGVGDNEFYQRTTRNRVTRAELVYVKLGGRIPWACFRDVFAVDGHAVRERDARLERLFLEGHPSALERAQAILAESAAHNIGPTTRTINLPTLPLAFLHPANQGRFRFERGKRRKIQDVEGVELRFEEVGRPTIVRGEGTRDLPAEGRFWIDPSRGTVLETEVRFEAWMPSGPLQQASLSVEYRPARHLAMWVPAEMKERYEQIAAQLAVNPTIVATARYSNYRRFSVAVDTEIRLPPE